MAALRRKTSTPFFAGGHNTSGLQRRKAMRKSWTGGFADDCAVYYGVSGNEAEHATRNCDGVELKKSAPEPVPLMAEAHGGIVVHHI